MDMLTAMLHSTRAQDAMVLRTTLEPPWSMRVQDEAPLTIFAVVQGEAWVEPAEGDPWRLGPGSVCVATGEHPYTVADAPGREPDIVVQPSGWCFSADGAPLHDALMLGTRTWGHPGGSTVMLVGTYLVEGAVGGRLLAALDGHQFVVDDQPGDPRLLALLEDELGTDAPGQQAVLDRCLDLLLIVTLRRWFTAQGDRAPGWVRAAGDPVVGPAVQAIHDDPAKAWTVATLADHVGVSRATLAKRFSEVMGEPPMTYLTDWRLTLAADLLLEPGATVGAVAPKVGYANPYAFSTAFSRHRGVSPRVHRSSAREPVDALTG